MLADLVVDIFAGKPTSRLKTDAAGRDLRVVSIKDVDVSISPLERLEQVRVLALSDLQRLQLQLNDIVITARGAVRSAVVREQHIGSLPGANLIVVRPKPQINAEAIAAYLRHPKIEELLLSDFAGSVTPGFSVHALKKLPIKLPSLEILSKLADLSDTTEKYIAAIEASAKMRRMITLEAIYSNLWPNEEDGL